MQDIDDYISSIIGNRKISEELGKWLIKKNEYFGLGWWKRKTWNVYATY